MNQNHRLERELTRWLVEAALPRTPDYTNDILRQTARLNQRPAWTFPERWLPMSVITLARQRLAPIPWRTIGLLAILALLLVLTIAIVIGGQRRVPSPFGPAANGVVAYDNVGDIYTVDPVSGARRAIVSGPTVDHDPRYSLDGTAIAFLRDVAGGVVLVTADADGSHQVVGKTDPLIDVQSIAWSPDQKFLALTSTIAGTRAISIINADDGTARVLDVGMPAEDVAWRPPDGRELLFLGGAESRLGLFLVSADGTGVHELPLTDADRSGLWLVGWHPSGQRLAFHRRSTTGDTLEIHVIDVDGGNRVVITSSDGPAFNAGYGRMSNDGSRIVFLDGGDNCRTLDSCNWLSVARTDGGPSVRLTQDYPAPYGTDFAWAPDDRWIITHQAPTGRVELVDPNGGASTAPVWAAEGASSWQRVAP